MSDDLKEHGLEFSKTEKQFLFFSVHEKWIWTYLRAPKELEAHIHRFWSTHEYYRFWKFELQTPSQHWENSILVILAKFGFVKTIGIPRQQSFKVRANQILDSGFYFFQKSQQSQNGVLFFSEISAISVFFSENLTNGFYHFLDPFGPIF